MKLTPADEQNLDAILRDRFGMDQRMAELAQQIMVLQQELGELSCRRMAISDAELAKKFEVTRPAIGMYKQRRLGRLG